MEGRIGSPLETMRERCVRMLTWDVSRQATGSVSSRYRELQVLAGFRRMQDGNLCKFGHGASAGTIEIYMGE